MEGSRRPILSRKYHTHLSDQLDVSEISHISNIHSCPGTFNLITIITHSALCRGGNDSDTRKTHSYRSWWDRLEMAFVSFPFSAANGAVDRLEVLTARVFGGTLTRVRLAKLFGLPSKERKLSLRFPNPKSSAEELEKNRSSYQ